MAHITDVAGLISAVAAGGSHTIAGNTTYRITSTLTFNVANTVITATGPKCIISGGDPITTWTQSGSNWTRTIALTDHPYGLRDDTQDARDLVYHLAANPTESVQDWNKGVSSWHTVTASTENAGHTTALAISNMSLISAGTRMHVESQYYAGHSVRVTGVSGGLAQFTPQTEYTAGVAADGSRGRVRVLNRLADLAACGAGHFVYDSVTDVMTVFPFASFGFSAATTLYASQSWGDSTPMVQVNAANVQLIGVTVADKVETQETFNTNSQAIRWAAAATGGRVTDCHSRNVGRWIDTRSTTNHIIHGGTSREGHGSYHYCTVGSNTVRGHGFTKMGRISSEGAIVVVNNLNGRIQNNWFHDVPRYAIYWQTPGNNVVIEKNIFYKSCRRNKDTGAIYSIDGPSGYAAPAIKPIIRQNYIRDSWGSHYQDTWQHPFYSMSIYLDENTSHVDILNNVLDGWATGGTFNNILNAVATNINIRYNIVTNQEGVTSHFEPFTTLNCAAFSRSVNSNSSFNAVDASCKKIYSGAFAGSQNCTTLSDRRANDINANPLILRNTNGWVIGLAANSPLKLAGVGWTDLDVTTLGPRGLGLSGEWDAITGFGPSGGGGESGTATATPTPPSSPASIIINEWNGVGVTTDKVDSSVRFKRVDNSLVDSLNPIAVPDSNRNFSYEKWLRLGIGGGGPLNRIANIKFYTDGTNSFGEGVRLWAEVAASHDFRSPTQPDNVNPAPAGGSGSNTMTDVFSYTALGALSLSSAAETFSGTSTNIGRFVVLALGVDPCADSGTLAPEGLSWSYDES